MSFYKPGFRHPKAPQNRIGLTESAYEGQCRDCPRLLGKCNLPASGCQAIRYWLFVKIPHILFKPGAWF